MRTIRPLFAAVALLLLATAGRAATVTVFAAASLTDALREIGTAYEQQGGDKIVFNFAGSGTLARQIEAGAPADIFISADESRVDALAKQGLLAAGTRKDLLGNSLVIITGPEEAAWVSAAELTNAAVQRVALGDSKTVPCGLYARIYLERQGLWAGVAPKMVPFDNVRAVLAAVETGNADAGIVYRTDALRSHKVKVALAIPAADGPGIRYPLAVVKDAPEPAAAGKFAAYLETGAATAVFEKFGFRTFAR